MRLFVSAGEPSGDLHGASLMTALRRRDPGIDIHGFGGDRMENAGCRIHYPLTNLAGVGFLRVLSSIPLVPGILKLADRLFREHRPDALVLVDFPAFHWWLAKCAQKHGIPVVWFVPPQLWAWAGWRVKWMRRLADHVLCTLPFEQEWYRQRGVESHYIGHPYFDELHSRKLDADFLTAQRAKPGTIIALLLGSRRGEIKHNFGPIIKAARILHARRPDLRFLVACLRPEHAQGIEERLRGETLPIEVHAGRTGEIIHLAHSAIAKSGSVSLEMLYHGTPTVVVYQVAWAEEKLARLIIPCRYASLVNLLLDKMLFPEHLGSHLPPEEIAGDILYWLDQPSAYAAVKGELAVLRERVATPGACDRAAKVVVEVLAGTRRTRRAG